MDVFDLAATLSLDSSSYVQNLNDAKLSATEFEGQSTSVASKVSKGFKTAAVAGGVIAGVGAAITGAFVKAAKGTADYGDKVDKMSQKIGISAESYQKWDYVMQRAGGNVDSLKMGMKTLSQQAEKNNESFQKLGISQEEVANLSQEELFEKTVKGLAGMEQGTERAAIASELLGRAGADMGPLLNQGSGAIEEQMEIAEKYGMIMPDSAVKASAAFQDSLTTMSMTFQGLKNRMMAEFLPAMTQVTDGMAKLFAGDMSGADDVAEGIEGIIDKVGEVLPTILEIGGRIIGHLAKGFMDHLPEILSAVGNGLLNVLSKIGEMISKIPSLFGKADLAGGFQDAIAKFYETLPEIANNIANFISGLADWLVENGPDLIIALAKGIITALPNIISAMGTIVNAILRVVIGLPARLLAMGLAAIMKFAVGILKGAGKAVSGMASTVSRVVKAVASLPGKLLGAAGKAMASFGRGIVNGGKKAWKFMSDIVSRLKKIPGDAIKSFYNVGSDIINGVKRGISNAWDGLKKSVLGLFKNLPKPIRKFLKIKSPSRLFAEEVGKWIPLGVASGIKENMDAVDDALEDIAPDEGEYTVRVGAQGDGSSAFKQINFNPTVYVDGARDPEEYAKRFISSVKQEVRTV